MEYSGCPVFDYSRKLKAKLPKKDYPEFIKNYGLSTRYDSAIHNDNILSHLKYGNRNAPGWWDMDSKNIDDCYFVSEPEKGYFVDVRYQNGWLYFREDKF